MIKNTLSNNSEIQRPQRIIAAKNLFKWCAHGWRRIAEGILQVALITVLCLKLSVKKHCVAKALQGIWKRSLYDNNRNYDYNLT